MQKSSTKYKQTVFNKALKESYTTTNWDLSQEKNGGLISANQSMWKHCINKMKDKNHMTNLNRHRKSCWQNSTSIHDKISQQRRYGGNTPQYNKGNVWQTHSQGYTQCWKAESIPSKIRNKARISTLTTFIQYSIESPRDKNQTRKRNKKSPNWKGRCLRLPLFSDDMMQYVENSKDVIKKLLE